MQALGPLSTSRSSTPTTQRVRERNKQQGKYECNYLPRPGVLTMKVGEKNQPRPCILFCCSRQLRSTTRSPGSLRSTTKSFALVFQPLFFQSLLSFSMFRLQLVLQFKAGHLRCMFRFELR